MSSPTAPDSDAASPSARIVVMLSGDLIFASRVQSVATAAGLEFRLSGNLPTDLAPTVSHVIIDLSTRSKVVDGLMELCRMHYPDAQVLAYAPHVQVERIRAARAHGVPVVTRGQFNEKLASLFA